MIPSTLHYAACSQGCGRVMKSVKLTVSGCGRRADPEGTAERKRVGGGEGFDREAEGAEPRCLRMRGWEGLGWGLPSSRL